MRILQIQDPGSLKSLMQEMKVDPYGIKIMLPKTMGFLVKLRSIPNINANILKQEMLSLGADAALNRGSLTGQVKKTDCLLIGNLAQLNRLCEKLTRQPFGLSRLGSELSLAIMNYQKKDDVFDLGRFKLDLGKRPYIMGILNLTPDSFSGDGVYKVTRSPGYRPQVTSHRSIMELVEKMVGDGADIIDVGGESARPQARAVSLKEELSRTMPVVKLLAKKIKVPISIDTRKPEVAKRALENGAVIVNDISGLRNPKMAKVAAKHGAAVIIMHMQGEPRSMQKSPHYISLMDELLVFFEATVKRALDCGIREDKIIIDPGIGFGKTIEHNLQILKHLGELKVLGKPILVGTSRKSFIGKILNTQLQERVFGTIASCVLAANNGARIIRVHDVCAVSQALRVFQAIDNN